MPGIIQLSDGIIEGGKLQIMNVIIILFFKNHIEEY